MNIDLSGKTALITGGARGIGAAISRTLALAGAKVIINFNRSGAKAEDFVFKSSPKDLRPSHFRPTYPNLYKSKRWRGLPEALTAAWTFS